MVWINYVLIAVIVIIIVFLLLWSHFNVSTITIQTDKRLQSTCTNADQCAPGFVCDYSFNECKIAPGNKCDSFSQCPMGYYCSGVCVTGPYGQVRQNCPCSGNLICSQEGDKNLCKIVAGVGCTSDNQCVSNYCQNGVCAAGIADGLPCSANPDSCLPSSHCDSFGFCQPQGITSGQAGAACQTNQPPPTISIHSNYQPLPTAIPITGTSAAAGCNIGNVCFNGHCAIATAGLGSACGERTTCVPPMVCSIPSKQTVGTCIYDMLVNSCPNNICASGFTCNDNLCYANTAQACSVNADCKSAVCSSSPAIFSLSGGVLQNTNPRWVSTPEPPKTSVKRMVGSGYNSRMYLISTQGLYAQSGQNWILVLAGNNLVDGAANGNSIFLLAIQSSGGTALYTYNTQNNAISPFNTATGLQVDNNGAVISPTAIDVSSNNSVVMAVGSKLYILQNHVFSLLNEPSAAMMPRWYYPPSNIMATGNDIAYLDTDEKGVFFTGAVSGVNYPQGSTSFTIMDYSIAPNGNMGIIAASLTTGAINYYIVIDGSQYILPGFAGRDGRILVTNNNIWIYTTRTCS